MRKVNGEEENWNEDGRKGVRGEEREEGMGKGNGRVREEVGGREDEGNKANSAQRK